MGQEGGAASFHYWWWRILGHRHYEGGNFGVTYIHYCILLHSAPQNMEANAFAVYVLPRCNAAVKRLVASIGDRHTGRVIEFDTDAVAPMTKFTPHFLFHCLNFQGKQSPSPEGQDLQS